MDLATKYRVEPGSKVDLKDWKTDDADGVDRAWASQRLAENTEAMRFLQNRLYAEKKQSLLVVLQAMDTAGKDSTIRHVFGPLNPAGVRVTPFGRPTDEELGHDFLWRIHQHTPQRGFIQIFNRSHYEDVLVVRVNDLVPKKVWQERYDIINAFEHSLNESNTRVVKIYLNLSRDRQREKLAERLTTPHKQWKFEIADLATRRRWHDYMKAYEHAITKCNTSDAPWYIVPTDRKWFRLAAVSEIIRAELERMDPQFPDADVDPKTAMRELDSIG
ncbi:MAG: PPK2 family polyphosphate kinase [Phycisphaerales bacterium]